MLTFVLAVLGLVGVTVWLLSVPLDLKVRVNSEQEKKITLQIAWFYGLLQLQPDAPRKPGSVPPSKPRIALRRHSNVDVQERHFIWAMFRSPGFLSRVLRFMVDVLRAIEFRDNAVFLRLGLLDPADTGQAAGVLGPMLMWLPNARFEPDFHNACLVLHADSTVRIVPLRFVKLALIFSFSPEVWRAVRGGIGVAR
jgi:hypothetical protein